MKKLLTFAITFIILMFTVSAADMTIFSDETTQYMDINNGLQNSVATWVHPEWTNQVNIPGATWIWRTYYVTEQEAIEGSQVDFYKTFDLPKCAENIQGQIQITTDNEYAILFGHVLVGTDANWPSVGTYDLSQLLQAGTNQMKFVTNNAPLNGGVPTTNPAGLIYRIDINYDCEDAQDVPEFGVIGALAVLAGTGLFIYKRRN